MEGSVAPLFDDPELPSPPSTRSRLWPSGPVTLRISPSVVMGFGRKFSGGNDAGVPGEVPGENCARRSSALSQDTLRGPGSMIRFWRWDGIVTSGLRSGWPASYPYSPSNCWNSYQLAFLLARYTVHWMSVT